MQMSLKDNDEHEDGVIGVNTNWTMPPLADPTIRKTMVSGNCVDFMLLFFKIFCLFGGSIFSLWGKL